MVQWELQDGKYVRDPRLGHRFGINFKGYLETNNSNVQTFQLSTDNYGFIHNGVKLKRQDPYKDHFNEKILIIGGSLAMGLGASCNKLTIASQLERLINGKYNKNIEVINAACGGYCSWNSVIQLSMELIRIKPIAVIDISGWNDFMHSSWGSKKNGKWLENHDRSIEDIFLAILDAQKKLSFIDRFRYSLVRSKLYLNFKRLINLSIGRNYSVQDLAWGHDNNILTYKEKGITNFLNNIITLNGVCNSHNIKYIHLLQPNPIWNKNLLLDESDQVSRDIKLYLKQNKNILELTKKYLSTLKKAYLNNEFDLTSYEDLSDNDNFLLEDWHDHCHLSDKGQLKLANYIFNNYYE